MLSPTTIPIRYLRITSEKTKTPRLDEVIEKLDQITEGACAEEHRLGYFSALYGRVTKAVRAGVQSGLFRDGPRMERFDAAFAGRYFNALERYRNGDRGVLRAWQIAFDACMRGELTILQHIYLGMNAHLLVDLAVVAAEVCPGPEIHDLRSDFLEINDIVSSLMRDVDRDVGRVSRVIGAVDTLAGGAWDLANNITIRGAREIAWNAALVLAPLDDSYRDETIARLDSVAVCLATQVLDPGTAAAAILREVRTGEIDVPSKVIRILQGASS